MHNKQTPKGGERSWEMVWNLTYGIQKRPKDKQAYNQLFPGFSTKQLFKRFKVFFHSALNI